MGCEHGLKRRCPPKVIRPEQDQSTTNTISVFSSQYAQIHPFDVPVMTATYVYLDHPFGFDPSDMELSEEFA